MTNSYVSIGRLRADVSERVSRIIDNRVEQPNDTASTYTIIRDPETGDILAYEDWQNYLITYGYSAAYPGCKTNVKVRKADSTVVYDVNYVYDLLGRLTDVNDIFADSNVAHFQYDENGNRTQLKYWLTGQVNGPNTVINYSYDIENRLTGITADGNAASSGEPNYTFTAADANDIDGLGR